MNNHSVSRLRLPLLMLRRLSVERRDRLVVVHLWFGLIWWVGIVAFWIWCYFGSFPHGVPAIIAVTLLAFILALFDNIRIVRITWSSGTVGRIFAIKNTFDFQKEDFEVVVFPNGGAALLRHSIDPMHELILVLPGMHPVSIWPDVFCQLIAGSGVRLFSCHRQSGLQRLNEALDELTEAERAALAAELETTDFLNHLFPVQLPDCLRRLSASSAPPQPIVNPVDHQ